LLNKHVHSTAAEFISCYRDSPDVLACTNIDSIVTKVHPVLWEFLVTLTSGKKCTEEMTHKQLSPVSKARTMYCLCVILFTANPECCYPFHLTLTDLILCHGGTKDLITILNRFGAVACMNTHYRFLKKLKSEYQCALLRELHPNAFWVVSVDNIGIMQSHAQVYVDSPHRSWHGTSIQTVEPKPLLPRSVDAGQSQAKKRTLSFTPVTSQYQSKRVCNVETPQAMRQAEMQIRIHTQAQMDDTQCSSLGFDKPSILTQQHGCNHPPLTTGINTVPGLVPVSPSTDTQLVPTTAQTIQPELNKLEFQISSTESAALLELKKKFFNYALIKHTIADTNSKVSLQFHQYLIMYYITLL